METFNIENYKIEFNDRTLRDISFFRRFFCTIYPSVQKNFENQFLEIKFNSSQDNPEYIHMDYVEEIENLLLNSCKEIINSVTDILHQNRIYSYDLEDISNSIKSLITDALQYEYPYYYFNDNTDIFSEIQNFNKSLQKDKYKKAFFIINLCMIASYYIASSVLNLITTNGKDFYDGYEFSFDDEEALEYMTYNNIKKTRDNIERTGISASNISIYISTFAKAPFNAERYFYLIKAIGDSSTQIERLFTLIFGGSKLLRQYKEELIELKSSIPNMRNCNESQLNDFLQTVDMNCKYYGLSNDSSNLYLQINSKLEKIDKDKRTIDGVEYDTREEAEIVQKDIDNIHALLNKNSLIFYKQSCDRISEITPATAQGKEEISKILSDFKTYKNQCKDAVSSKGKKKLRFIIILCIWLVIMFFLLAFGFLGIIADLVIIFFLTGYYSLMISQPKKMAKDYEEYCKQYNIKN